MRRTRVLLILAVVAVVIGVAVAGYAFVSGGSPRASFSGAPSSSVSEPASGPGSATGASPSRKQSCVDATVAKLGLEGQVGQLLMVGTPVDDPVSIGDTATRYKLGGVFLAGRSTRSAASLRLSIRALPDPSGLGLLVATDQEGGEVQSLKGNDFPPIPSAVQQGQWDTATLRARTSDWAGRLAKAGLTMDLAPVADTVPAGTAASNPPIGAFNRQYGSDPDAVAQDISTVVGAAQSAGILTTLKHFPGLGRVRANTDTSTAAVDPVTTVDDPYLKPFASGIKAGTAAVMVSSASYPKLDPQSIAAFSSPVITGLLRQRMGFTGVVISDDLGAAVAVKAVPVGDRAVRFVRAGGDIVLTVRSADAAPMSAALLAAARGSSSFAARVTDAARHVVAAKVRAGLVRC
jgi:beta-N-acetylhexosaminidase